MTAVDIGTVRVRSPERAQLAESPRWDGSGWWWADVPEGKVWRWVAGSAPTLAAHLGSRVSLVVPRVDGDAIVALGTHLVAVDEAGRHTSWSRIGTPSSGVLNDGVPDPTGGLWIGSVDTAGGPGGLFRVDRTGSVTEARTGFAMSNGMAWSSDHRHLFHADSGDRVVWRHEVGFDRVSLTRSERWLELDGPAMPDGVATDRLGGVWVAMYGVGEVRRYSREKRVSHVVRVPAKEVTAVEFGGPDLCDILITTARESASAAADPAAGHLYTARAPFPGVRRPLGRIDP